MSEHVFDICRQDPYKQKRLMLRALVDIASCLLLQQSDGWSQSLCYKIVTVEENAWKLLCYCVQESIASALTHFCYMYIKRVAINSGVQCSIMHGE